MNDSLQDENFWIVFGYYPERHKIRIIYCLGKSEASNEAIAIRKALARAGRVHKGYRASAFLFEKGKVVADQVEKLKEAMRKAGVPEERLHTAMRSFSDTLQSAVRRMMRERLAAWEDDTVQ